jgi:hypothetical protein
VGESCDEDEKGNVMSQISPSYVTGLEKYINELRNQVSTLKVELREICAAIDDPACDLTLTAVECIKKLKAENEWQPIETAPKDNAVFLAWRKHATHPLMVRYEPSYDWFANYDGEHVYDLTHWMPLPKPPARYAAILQGEQE